MTDTPVNPRDVPSVPRSEMIKAFIGDLARPFAIVSISGATAGAIIIAALKSQNGTEGGIVVGAAGLIVGGMYGFKEWGTTKQRMAETNAAAPAPLPPTTPNLETPT